MKKLLAVMMAVAAGGSTLLSASCQEPPKTAKYEYLIANLADLHVWHPQAQGKGNLSYESIMGAGPEILPQLVEHISDPTPTAIYDELSGRNPVVGDLCFLMLLRLMNQRWQDFEGVFISTALPNPVFCIKWNGIQGRRQVQERFRTLLEAAEQEK